MCHSLKVKICSMLLFSPVKATADTRALLYNHTKAFVLFFSELRTFYRLNEPPCHFPTNVLIYWHTQTNILHNPIMGVAVSTHFEYLALKENTHTHQVKKEKSLRSTALFYRLLFWKFHSRVFVSGWLWQHCDSLVYFQPVIQNKACSPHVYSSSCRTWLHSVEVTDRYQANRRRLVPVWSKCYFLHYYHKH